VARCGEGGARREQAGGISLPRRSGKPGRSLGCHRDMLAVEDKVLEHADPIIGSTVDSVESLRIDCRVIRRRERRPE
jgi:hypothetical protein